MEILLQKEDRRIRIAGAEDAKALLEIYAPYVRETAVTFEYDVPSEAEFRGRILHTLEKYPYLVAEQDGEPVGYAYAGAFHTRAAYERGVETTVYIRKDRRRGGLGRELYEALEKILVCQNILNLNACIGYPETEDEYLTKDSARFHERQGFRPVGRFHKCGYKFGRWYDMIWMEKHIGEHRANPAAVRWFPKIREEVSAIFCKTEKKDET